MKSVAQYLLTILLFTMVFLPCAQASESSNEVSGENKRFKIFIAEYNTIFNNKSVLLKSIFKIDLDTGTVWRYRQGKDSKGKPFEEFFEVPNQ